MKRRKNKPDNVDHISRKKAIKKMGCYAAYTALGTMVLLSPKKAQATSVTPSPPKRDYW